MVNYIKHMNAAISRIAEDERCTSSHASLYYALFYCWNSAFFRVPISINRHEVMFYAGIGSTNTYHKCIKDLHEWGYIRYKPSTNKMIGSKVSMIRFDRAVKSQTKKTKIKSATTRERHANRKKTTRKQDVNRKSSGSIQVVRRSINSKNNKNITNHKNTKNAYEQANANSDLPIGKYRNTGNRKGNRKTGKGAEQPGKPENLDQVVSYFEEKKSTGAEAEKFFNYFESVGWRVGGRSLMRDWRAAARNWIANIPNYNTPRHDKNKVFKPQLTGKKNYAEPF